MITENEITEIVEAFSYRQLDDGFCRAMVAFMVGYLSRPETGNERIEDVRQHFYGQIKQYLERHKART